MSVRNTRRLQRSMLSVALAGALAFTANAVTAQEAQQQDTATQDNATELDKVVVTGSLIPQTKIETFTPVTVISAEDIKVRGFTTVSDAIQQSSFANGSIQGSQSSASFTQGAETVSLFGLSVSYTKYLIDGRPMADYPALYNGSDAFNNISGIPIDLVERIEILPGGQSSLYGSDAIAGVINIILKKRVEAPVVSIRGGTYTDGGGDSGRISAAKGFSFAEDRFNLLLGAQYENVEPIWAYDRALTSQFNTNGTSAPIASRDFLVYGFRNIATRGFGDFGYSFMDPNGCANVTDLFEGTVGFRTRPGSGDYCGSFSTPGYRTLKNSKDAFQVYTHATLDLGDNHQLYGDVLYSDEEVGYHIGSNYTWWGTGVEWGYYYDPSLDGLVNLQRAFAPEDMGPGGFENSMSYDESRSFAATVGGRGTLGANWDYDASLSHTEYKLNERGFARFADPINQWFVDNVLGPQQGWDPYFGAYPVFTPDYAAFYQPISPEDFHSFTGYTNSESTTENTLARFQVTNAALFSLPGGDAGLAIAVEGARETWEYNPDDRLMNGEIWGTTSVDGAGERDRYAVTAEMRLPVLESLTASVSGRYDDFRPDGAESVDKATYSLGLEYRPIESLLFRGKYGTAFKAPTLADQFQAISGYYSFVTDYYNCALLGFDPSEVDGTPGCPARYASRQFFGETSGSLDLEPLTADVWSYGLVWAPTASFSLSADYHHWDIRNEVGPQNADGLALREMYCRTGEPGYAIDSPICQDALSKIVRNSSGAIVYIFTPKVNEARQVLDAVSANASYHMDAGGLGDLLFRASYTNTLEHKYWQFEGDEGVDLLRRPGWSSAPKSKANASVTWSRDDWSTTLYANRVGHTPNYRSRVLDSYDDPNGQASVNDGRVYAGKLKPFTLYNLSVSFKPTDRLDLSFMVNNLFNDMPPEDITYPGTSGAPYNSGQYTAFGRAFYVEARYTFGPK